MTEDLRQLAMIYLSVGMAVWLLGGPWVKRHHADYAMKVSWRAAKAMTLLEMIICIVGWFPIAVWVASRAMSLPLER